MNLIKSFKTVIYSLLISIVFLVGCQDQQYQHQTKIKISIPKSSTKVDSMIYGQMLEDCNDKIIYGGIVNMDGAEREHITEMLRPLNIPVVRWPAGTYIHEYQWERGIGSMENRPETPCIWWGGIDNHRFGTDEFLAWCKKLDIAPYININMGRETPHEGTLEEAMNWIEYVNGDEHTLYGQKRIANGHIAPYNVEYWCLGNENYGPWGGHKTETATEYASKLSEWASSIKSSYPDLKLLAVGHTPEWDDTVLVHGGHLVDYITQHYYINSWIKDGKIERAEHTSFAPAVVEGHLQRVISIVKKHNVRLGRADNPIKISVDEWNNRHLVYDAEVDDFRMSRQDERLLTDAAVVAGMLNVFVRNSPDIGMGTYIFPVNGHGLIKTVGETDAYRSSIYYVFELYRRLMHGQKLDIEVVGEGVYAKDMEFALEFGLYRDTDMKHLGLTPDFMNYIDAAAVVSETGELNIALVNRSATIKQTIKLDVPKGYQAYKQWLISHEDISAHNNADQRDIISTQEIKLNKSANEFELTPCAVTVIQLKRK